VSKQFGRGGVSSRKHGIGGHPSPNPRHLMEAVRALTRGRVRRPPAEMVGSVRELFERRRKR
jgi:hypothetical protein